MLDKNTVLLYCADFENIPDTQNTADILKLAGFYTKETGNARFGVESGRLHITGDSEKQIFLDIPKLNSSVMSSLDEGYTLQYDITHILPQSMSLTSSVSLVSECADDCSAFIEIPIRAKGRTGHDICIGNCRMALTKPGLYSPGMHGRAEGQTALVDKLLPVGIYDNTRANDPYLMNKKTVVRIYHEPCGRETAYMLVPEEYGGRGEWAIVSCTARDSAGDPYRLLGILGKSVKLRISANSNCLIESIKAWSGLDVCDEKYPKLEKHIFGEPLSGRWLLDEMPEYDGGTLSQKLFLDSSGYYHLCAGDSKMQLVSNTDRQEFEHYADKLGSCGFALQTVKNSPDILSYRIIRDNFIGYMYYAAARHEARIIVELQKNVLPEDFSYTYAKSTEESTRIYIYGLHMDPNGLNLCDNNSTASNCGMLLILKLADDSVMIIDGGGHPQMNEIAGSELDRFLHKITKTPDDGRVIIRNWFITHDHGDHFNGFIRFLVNYHEKYEIERVMSHFAAIHLPPNIKKLFGELLPEWYPNIKYYKPHTGESIRLADTFIDVLYTLEDEVDALTADYCSADGNDVCTCIRLCFDGGNVLIIGDIYYYAAGVLMLNQLSEGLKSDILQISHHGLNDLGVLYSYARPDIALYPQRSSAADKINNGHGKTVYNNVIKYLSRGHESICFAGDGTYGIEFIDGKPCVVHFLPVIGRQYGGWDTFDSFETDGARDNIVQK